MESTLAGSVIYFGIPLTDKYTYNERCTMARPQPTIIIEHVESKTYKAEQVLEADAVYAVFYEDRPVNLRSLNKLVNSPAPKYKKVNLSKIDENNVELI